MHKEITGEVPLGSDKRQDAFEYLVDLAGKQGYVTFDDIMDCADERDLPIQDFDWLSSGITTRGIIVYDEPPENLSAASQDDEYYDYAHADYDQIYEQIMRLYLGIEDSSYKLPLPDVTDVCDLITHEDLRDFVISVRNIVPPQRKEFGTLIYQAKEGNAYARNRIIEMHIRMALKVALQNALAYDLDIEETIGDACVGLIMAADKYDPDTRGSFSAYASMWIRQNIFRQRPTKRPLIYYPFHIREQFYSAYSILKEYGYFEYGMPDQLDYAAMDNDEYYEWRELDYTDKRMADVLAAATPIESLDELSEMSQEEEKQDELLDAEGYEGIESVIPYDDVSGGDINTLIENNELKTIISDCMQTLTQREREVLTLRYGLNGRDGLSLEQTGNLYGVTRERIRQIEKKALRKMRHPYRSKRLKDFLD